MSNTEPVEPTVEETVEPTPDKELTVDEMVEIIKAEQEKEPEAEPEIDPTLPVITLQQMSVMLTNQTFTIIAAIGEALIGRYRQMSEKIGKGLPPKAKKDREQFQKGYLAALNDVAIGLQQYQDDITQRAIEDGVLVPADEDVPDLPEEYQEQVEETSVPEVDGQSE